MRKAGNEHDVNYYKKKGDDYFTLYAFEETPSGILVEIRRYSYDPTFHETVEDILELPAIETPFGMVGLEVEIGD